MVIAPSRYLHRAHFLPFVHTVPAWSKDLVTSYLVINSIACSIQMFPIWSMEYITRHHLCKFHTLNISSPWTPYNLGMDLPLPASGKVARSVSIIFLYLTFHTLNLFYIPITGLVHMWFFNEFAWVQLSSHLCHFD